MPRSTCCTAGAARSSSRKSYYIRIYTDSNQIHLTNSNLKDNFDATCHAADRVHHGGPGSAVTLNARRSTRMWLPATALATSACCCTQTMLQESSTFHSILRLHHLPALATCCMCHCCCCMVHSCHASSTCSCCSCRAACSAAVRSFNWLLYYSTGEEHTRQQPPCTCSVCNIHNQHVAWLSAISVFSILVLLPAAGTVPFIKCSVSCTSLSGVVQFWSLACSAVRLWPTPCSISASDAAALAV